VNEIEKEWAPDWQFTHDEERNTKGYILDMLLKARGAFGGGRICTVPCLPAQEFEDEDAFNFLIGSGLKALGECLVGYVPEEKVKRWRG